MRFKSLTWIFIPFVFAALHLIGAAQVATTPVTDTIYHADGTTATGTVLISWPAFTTISGQQVPAGNTSTTIAPDGTLSVHLVSNSGAIPIGTYYTVTYHLDDNSVTRQYWVVPPSTTPVRVAAIESSVLPVSVAMQTVSKSYVDSSIAAAVAGNSGGSTAYVLKSGDTMTGPLTLPANPTSALQAATKQYVDSVATSGGGSGLSGQTVNYLPMATSATTSTTSSKFYQDPTNGVGGLQEPFYQSTTGSQCNLPGIFDSCNYNFILDRGDTTFGSRPGSAVLTSTIPYVMGGGSGGNGGEEGRVTIMQNDDDSGNGIVTSGIKQLYKSGMSVYGAGDIGIIYHQNYVHGGFAYGSDQGTQNYIDLEENAFMVMGTVNPGSDNRQIRATQTAQCLQPSSYLCVPSPGSWVIDTSVPVASGKGLSVNYGATGWANLASVTTDQTNIPKSTVYGLSTTPIAPAANGYDDPVSTDIVLASGVGSFAVGDPVCVLGNGGSGFNFEEQSVLTAVSGSAGTQTLTLPLALPQHGPAVFKGYCMYLSTDADWAQHVRYALPAVSIDGVHILYGYPIASSLGVGPIPTPGMTYGAFDGGPNSGWHLYYGARVWKVDTNSPNYQPLAFNFITTYVEPNGVFSPGDTMEAVEFPAQKIDGIDLYSGMDMAGLTSNSNTTLQLHLMGKGNNASAAILHAYNQQDTSTYTPFGGPMNEPTFMTTAGVFDLFSYNQYAPLSYAFSFAGHQPGQSQYYVWSDPWGQLRIDSTQTWDFDNSSIKVQGSGSFGGVVQAGIGLVAGPYGSSSGTFGTRYNFGNGTSPAVYIAPEYAIGNQNTHLAVTTQAESRTPAPGDDYAAPDGTLDMANLNVGTQATVNNLTVTGACTGCASGGAGFPITGNGAALTNPSSGVIRVTGPGGGTNANINFGTDYGNFDMTMYDGGAAQRYGWGLTGGTMNFVVPSLANSGGHIGFGDTGDLTGSGYMMFLMRDRLAVPSAGQFAWSSTSDAMGTLDTGLSRGSAGVVNVGNGTAGDTSGTLNAAIVNASTLLRTASYTVSTLPSAATAGAGAIVRVSDASSFTAGACSGGGSDSVLAISDGTAWTCH